MRALNKYEFARMQDHFDSIAKTMVNMSLIVQYYRASYTAGGVSYPQINSTFEEPGFYGLYNPGSTGSRNGAGDVSVQFVGLIKMPTKFYEKGFRIINPDAPHEAQGLRFDLKYLTQDGPFAISGRPSLVGIKINRIYGQPYKLASEATFKIEGLPRQLVDGVSFEVSAQTVTGFQRFPPYMSPEATLLWQHQVGLMSYILDKYPGIEREEAWERFNALVN